MRSGRTFTRRDRLRYRIDDALARGEIWWVILGLGGLMTMFLFIAALLIGLTGLTDDTGRRLGYVEGLWQALLRALDPGTIAGDSDWELRLVALVVTLAGILLLSTVIGLVASGMHARLSELRRGRAPVIESGHTLVLGWSPKVQTIVLELAEAQLADDPCVVILAPVDKGEMDDHLRGWGLDGRIRVVARTGSPQERSDLQLVHPELARSVIILRDGDQASDARVIKTVLALVNDLRLPDTTPIVAEIGSRTTAESLRRVVSDQVIVVEPGDLVGRVIAQSCRHPGLDLVLCDLFDFAGSEIYEIHQPELVGRPFLDALTSYAWSIPIGIDRPTVGPIMKPPMDMLIEAEDRLILLSEDPQRISFTGPLAVRLPAPRPERQHERPQEVTLMFGFNEFAPIVIAELDDYVPRGSRLTIVVDPTLVPEASAMVPHSLEHLDVRVQTSQLGAAAVSAVIAEERPDHVVVLCYRDGLAPADADARALVTFLEAGRALSEQGIEANLVTEILDSRDLDLVPDEWIHGFIVTERLSSLYITQVSENPSLVPVFGDLLDAEGSEMYFKPVGWYLDPDDTETFADVILAAAVSGDIAVGYRRKGASGRPESITLNPPLREQPHLQPEDDLIVLAEDER